MAADLAQVVTWSDAVQAIASIASAVAAFFVIFSLRQTASSIAAQNDAADTSAVLSIWERLDVHWCRFRNAESSERQFEFGQLISYYEMSCRLFRDKIFKTKAAITLYEHLHEILPIMRQNEDFQKMFDALKSEPETFENIIWICERPKHIFRKNLMLKN